MTASAADLPPLIEARGLEFLRDEEPIFGPLNFALRAGEALAVEGANGAGKTTLIRVLAGLIEPSAGELRWHGVSVDADNRALGGVALLGHSLGLKGELTPLENVRFRIALHGLRQGIAPHQALLSVGLQGYDDVPVRTLSAGQRKRVALAALLVSAAGLWLLDEPYANLDREGQCLVDRMLETHCRRGGAVVFTSHGLYAPTLTQLTTLRLHGCGA
jgi:heme exporter protein A